MAKDPAFLFYPGDWLGGTLGMTFEEKGAYMELLMMQFNRGHMAEHMIGQCVGQLWVKLQDKFVKDSQGLWFNERLDIEKNKRKKYVESRTNNKKGSNQHSKKQPQQEGHMTSHMEDENKDEDISELGKGVPGENLKKELGDLLMSDFGFTELNHFQNMRWIYQFLDHVEGEQGLVYFKETYADYKEYKKIAGYKHGFVKLLGSPAMGFTNGLWNTEIWTDKLKEHQSNATGTTTKPSNQPRGTIIPADTDYSTKL